MNAVEKFKKDNPDKKVLYAPHEGPQTAFHASTAYDVLYGGAKGGGKSDAGLAESVRYAHVPGYKALIARRTYDELLELRERADKVFPHLQGLGLMWDAGNKQWKSKQGATIRFRSFKDPDDVRKVDGQEFQYIFLDQIEQFTVEMIDSIKSCARSTVPNLKPRFRASANPGGVSHAYIKDHYIDKCRPVSVGEPKYWEEFDITYQPVKPGPVYTDEFNLTRQFIPAFVWDNPAILDNNPEYIYQLKSLPKTRMRALLFGDWDIFVGQFFTEFDYGIHVVKPFPIPSTWRKFASVDYGYAAPFVILWHAVDDDGNVWTYREYAERRKPIGYHARKFLDLSSWQVGNQNREFERISGVILPHDMRQHIPVDTGYTDDTRLDVWEREIDYKYPSIKSIKDRLAGWNTMREYLFHDRANPPRWRIFQNCEYMIKSIQNAVHDKTRPEDVHKDSDDHPLDAARIGLMHVATPATTKTKESKKDPWDSWGDPIRPIEQPSSDNWMAE